MLTRYRIVTTVWCIQLNGQVCANMSALIIITINIWLVGVASERKKSSWCAMLEHAGTVSWACIPDWPHVENWGVRKAITMKSTKLNTFLASHCQENYRSQCEDSSTPYSRMKMSLHSVLKKKKKHPNCKPISIQIRMNKTHTAPKDYYEWMFENIDFVCCFTFFRHFFVTFISEKKHR